MIRNYDIVGGRYLTQGRCELDLHNSFDFINLDYSVEKRKLVLSWVRTKRVWVSPDTPEAVTVEFNDVSEFWFTSRNAEMPFTEDDCMEVFGHWVDEDWCKGIVFLEAGQEAEPHWPTAINFMSGAVLAVQAESSSANIVIQSDPQ